MTSSAYAEAAGGHLRHVLAELHDATLKHVVHIGATELIGMLREGKTMAEFPYLEDNSS